MQPLPHNIELEKAIIWYLIIHWNEAEDIFLDLEIEYFYDSENKNIAEKLYEMAIKWEQIDLVSISSYIKNQMYLIECTENSSIASINTQVKHLEELYQRRNLIIEAKRLEHLWYNGEDLDEGVYNIFDRVNKTLSAWGSNIADMDTLIDSYEKYLKESAGRDMLWYSWGFPWIDEHTLWIRKWKTYRIWGLSGAGKTSFLFQVFESLIKQKKKILFFSLENSEESTFSNLLSTIQWVNPKSIQKWLVQADIKYLREAKQYFTTIYEVFNLSEMKREILKRKPDIVFVDYIGLVNIKGFNEKEKYDKYADDIKEFMQKNNKIAWVDLSNLNKSDNEATIREYKGFNWSAKLRNNTDFGMHIFPLKSFSDYKSNILKIWSEETKKNFLWKKALTFLISKNRLWEDDIQNHYIIDFNKGIRFQEANEDELRKWETLTS